MGGTEKLGPERRRVEGRPRAWLSRVGVALRPAEAPENIPLEEGARFAIGRARFEDPWMSGQHAELALDAEGAELCDLGSSNGTLLWGSRISRARLADGDVFATGGTIWRFHRRRVEGELPEGPFDDPLSSLRPEVAAIAARLSRVARTRVPVMLLGETGTGKEIFARRLHELSRRSGRFVAINAGAIQPQLVASELFGVERGAHSTADRAREGLVRQAEGGTLFLDEVGDMPLEVQVALLRLLEAREVLPVGGDRVVEVDVRVVCATHQDVDALIEAGRFRADLYARLKGCRLELPPLAERREDVGLLVGRLLERFGAADLGFSAGAYHALATYAWPHNVRELAQAIESAIALVERGTIELSHLPEGVEAPKAERRTDDVEEELRRVLSLHGGNVSAVARTMGKSRMQIHRWLKRYDLDPDAFR